MSNAIDVIEDLKWRATNTDGESIEEKIERAIDDGLIYTEDILSLIDRYIPASEIREYFYEKCYEALFEELYMEVK